MARPINEAGIALIKNFEGCVLEADMPTPNDRPTIGYKSNRKHGIDNLVTLVSQQ